MVQVSEKYAEALFSAAVSLGCIDTVAEDMRAMQQFAQRLAWYFKDPRIAGSEKAELVSDALSNLLDQLTLEFIIMILKRGHWRYLHSTADEFMRLSDEHYHRVAVFLHVPFKPEKEMLDKLESSFREKGLIPEDAEEITMQTIEDKGIVGGFIAFCNGHQIDASIRTQLTKIRRAER